MPAGTSEKPKRSWLRRLGIAFAVLLLLSVALRVALPYAIPPLAGWLAMRQVGLDARIENVDLEVFKGTLAVDGVWVGAPGRAPQDGAPADPAQALFALERLFADLAWTELFKGRVSLRSVTLDAPRVRVGRLPDGRLDPMHGATPPPPDAEAEAQAAAEAASAAAAEAAPGEAEQKGGWPIVIDDLALRGAVVRLVEEADEEELLSFALEELDLEAFSLDGPALGLGGIGVRRPNLRVQREFLLDPTGASKRPPEPETSEADEEEPAGESRGYRVDDLDIEGAAFQLVVGEDVLDLALSLKANEITLDPDDTFPFEFTLDVGETGHLAIRGEAGAAPPSFVGDVTLKDMPLKLLSLAVRPDLDDWVRNVSAEAELDVDFHALGHEGRNPGLNTHGRVVFSDLDISDPQGQDLSLSWRKLETQLRKVAVPLGDAAKTTPLRVEVARVSLVEPKVRYRRPSDAIERLSSGPRRERRDESPAVEVTEPEAEPGGPPPEIVLDRIEIQNGQVDFRDGAVAPPYQANVARLMARVDGVDVGAASARNVDVDVLFGDGSTLKVDGNVGATDGELDVKLRKVRLPPVNPYARAAGIALERGELTVDSHVKAKGRHWKIDNDVTLHDLYLDQEGSKDFLDKLDMPIDLILSLLRDPTGDIDLPVAVEFDEGEMETGVGELIAGALRQALVGAATIPLKALGGLFRRDGGFMLEPVPSAPGVVEATDDTAERGLAMASLLKERPELAIALTGSAGEADLPALQRAELTERVAAGGDLPDIEDGAGLIGRQQIKGALKKRAKGEAGTLSPENGAHLQRYFEATDVPDERYANLARARATSLQDWLVEKQGIEAGRVRIDEKTERGDPGVLLDLEPYSPSADPAAD